MPVFTDVCNVAMKDLFDGVHDAADVYKCLLISPTHVGTWDKNVVGVGTPGSGVPSPTNVGTDEVPAGNGYLSGGVVVTRAPVVADDVVNLDFDDAVWTGTIAAVGCIVYNDSKPGKPTLIIQSFGGTVTSSADEFRVAIANLLQMARPA